MFAGYRFPSRRSVQIPTRRLIICNRSWASVKWRTIMATLGKCLLFWLKYPAEMDRLYVEEERKVEGLPNPDRVLDKISLVGDTACREVADFLETCVPGIEGHLRAISSVERVRTNLEYLWQLKFWVAPRKATGKRFKI